MTWQVIGHEQAVASLARSVDGPSHAYLFIGPEQVGKRTVALEFARALMCEHSDDRPCHACRSCRLVDHGNHPDVAVAGVTAHGQDGGPMLIDGIRSLRQDANFMPMMGAWRVCVVRVDGIAEGAADAMLKMLEDPPPRVVYILLARDPSSLPETIVSRCRTVAFAPVATSLIDSELRAKGASEADAKAIAQASFGAVGWALMAAGDPERLVDRQDRVEAAREWLASDIQRRMAMAEGLAASSRQPSEARGLAIRHIEMILAETRDALLAAAGATDLALSAPNGLDDPASLLATIRAAAATAAWIRQNVDTRTALEALAVSV
jgi:DNA polymerase-3 subunit delta'